MEIWQAWEILAKEWGPDVQLSPEESELKRRVKQLARDWRTEHPNLDPDGKWCERLTFAFRWPQARKQIQNLIANRKLDISKVGLDLTALKKARDSIAHTGKMPTELYKNVRLAWKLLQRAQLGLQLILLSELGYSELVSQLHNVGS
jgi:hypothetical protein